MTRAGWQERESQEGSVSPLCLLSPGHSRPIHLAARGCVVWMGNEDSDVPHLSWEKKMTFHLVLENTQYSTYKIFNHCHQSSRPGWPCPTQPRAVDASCGHRPRSPSAFSRVVSVLRVEGPLLDVTCVGQGSGARAFRAGSQLTAKGSGRPGASWSGLEVWRSSRPRVN